jgi:tRNA modification GTPase
MLMLTGDTIVAISSAVGPAARMIVRASGPEACDLASRLSREVLPRGSSASRVSLRFSDLAVPASLYVFHAPRSYTGEHLIEFHIPGNPLLARLLLDTLIASGARLADPGEFTARAYFSGRIDLTEAEGVAATIAAASEQELRAARQLLAGELSRRLRPVTDLIAETLALVEVGIDFADEDVTVLTPAQLKQRTTHADELLRDLLEHSARFERLSHEPQIVLVGRPNAGKSTLLNALAGHERAITSPVAGTTRDVLSADVSLDRGIVKLIDAAGIEDHSPFTEEKIAQQMAHSARHAVQSADAVVLVRDVTDSRPVLSLSRQPDIVVNTKGDLLPAGPTAGAGLVVSAMTGENLELLRGSLDQLAFGDVTAGPTASLALNARHIRAVSEARAALARAAACAADRAAELVALELREALDAVGGVVGSVTPDELLGRIFSSFCIGK